MSSYMYDAVHNSIRRYEADDDDAVDERGLIKDGKRVRVPMMMMDSSAPPPGAKMWQHSPIPMRDSDILKDGNGSGEDGTSRVPRWAMNKAAQVLGRDSVTIDGDVKLVSRQELIDWDKAQLSARWKGGLAEGDRVRIGDKDLVVADVILKTERSSCGTRPHPRRTPTRIAGMFTCSTITISKIPG